MNIYQLRWGDDRAECYGDTKELAWENLGPNYKIGATYHSLEFVRELPKDLSIIVEPEVFEDG